VLTAADFDMLDAVDSLEDAKDVADYLKLMFEEEEKVCICIAL
jgi:hypothetical protein